MEKVFVKGGDRYVICPHCGAIYNANEAEFCPGCLNNLKLNYNAPPKKRKRKKLTPEQIEKKREHDRKRRQRKPLWAMMEEDLEGLDNDGQMW